MSEPNAPVELEPQPARAAMVPVAALKGHTQRVWCVAWSPVANVLASCSGDGTVRMWGCRGGQDAWECLSTLSGEHARTVRHVSWSASGEYLACASFDHTVSVWQRSSPDDYEMTVEGTLDGHESEVKCVAWASDCTLATCSRDRTVWVWDRVAEGEYECGGVLTGHSQDVKHCLWLVQEGRRPEVVSCGYDNTIRVWSDAHRRDDWQCVQTLSTHENTVWCVAVRPSADPATPPLLCSASSDLSLAVWRRRVADGAERFELACRCSGFTDRPIYAAGWAFGAPLLATANGDDSIALISVWEDAGGTHATVSTSAAAAHESDVNSVSFSQVGRLTPDGAPVLLASGGDDCLVRLWSVQLLPSL